MTHFNLSDISRHRGAIMGIAMICIILFHIGLPRNDAFYGLCRMGNFGVDVFFFLSGIGLWYSWVKAMNKAPDTFAVSFFSREWLKFYLRRLRRIYPAWLVVASAYYVPRFVTSAVHTPADWIHLAGDVLVNWGFWQHDELTFWYVPATMMLYIFAPPYIELVRRQPIHRWLVVIALMWCIAVQYITPIHVAVGHIEIFWSRVPIFFLGINIAASVAQGRVIDRHAVWMLLAVFVSSLAACVWLEQMRHGRFPLYTERMLYIPMAISFVILLSKALNHTPQLFNRAMIWIGGISLEIYLIHIEFVMRPVKTLHLGYWLTALLTIIITLPLAWLLQKILSRIVRI